MEVAVPTTASFKRLIISALIVPIGMMSCIAVILALQIKSLSDTAAIVEHANATVTQANRVEKLTIDLETGLRGYLLTADKDFLAPFVNARDELARETDALRPLFGDNFAQVARLDEIVVLRKQWVGFAERSIAALERKDPNYLAEARTKVGKILIDTSRAKFVELIGREEQLRDVRSRAARRASWMTLVTIAVVTLLGGLLLGWLARRQFLALAGTYQHALGESHQLNMTLEQRVTERTKQVEERSTQLAEANRELEAFSYSISHDLRAPMRHISGFAELLRKSAGPGMSADDNDNLTIIFDTAKNAGRMVDDLLALSRIGRQHLKKTNVDVNEIVRLVIRVLEPETRGRQVEWRVPVLPPINADSNLLRMVFQNLLANSVKYSAKKPSAVIELGASQDNGHVTYFIRDNGEGFDMQYVHKLFGVFQRLHRSEEFEGTGIGLANVRRIITRHGGRVWAEGKLGEGATLFFSLPLTETSST